jgi:DNA modification methylase
MNDECFTKSIFLNQKVELYGGDSREVLRGLPDNHFSSIVCDPPYALVSIVKRFGGENAAPPKDYGEGNGLAAYARAARGFMGKQWDTGETAFATEFWQQIYRVLKPGGHVVAFSGTRSYHRLAVAIEDSGFEIRDQLAWVYGSGFPKSHDVSKGIDKAAGAERKVVGKNPTYRKDQNDVPSFTLQRNKYITHPTTPEAVQWQGWGTALKPSWEPIVLARKPLSEKTVAANVLKWGTGALNISATRVFSDSSDTSRHDSMVCTCPLPMALQKHGSADIRNQVLSAPLSDSKNGLLANVEGCEIEHRLSEGFQDGCRPFSHSDDELVHQDSNRAQEIERQRFDERKSRDRCEVCGCIRADLSKACDTIPNIERKSQGRWPANLLHDGSDEVLAGFPDRGPAKASMRGLQHSGRHGGLADIGDNIKDGTDSVRGINDNGGSAARFFYSAKADKLDRIGSKHPTVKPVDLMQWLCRLVTPPGGRILDPFAGSGSTGEAAWREGFYCTLIEREDEYLADIAERLLHADKGPMERKARSHKQEQHHGPLFIGVT